MFSVSFGPACFITDSTALTVLETLNRNFPALYLERKMIQTALYKQKSKIKDKTALSA
jgi:hypothetical protein